MTQRSYRLLNVFLRNEAGNSVLEFSLCAGFLFMVIFGIMDFSRALSVDHYLANAASEATRYAKVRGATFPSACSSATAVNCYATQSSITTYIKSITPTGVNPNNVVITATWPGTTAAGTACNGSAVNSPGCEVKVKLTYPYGFVLAFLPQGTFTLTGTAADTISE